MNLINQLKQPFPFSRGLNNELWGLFRVSVFAILVLFLLKPFGLQEAPLNLFIGYWLVSFGTAALCTLAFNYVLDKWLNKEKWTVGKEVIKTLIYLLLVGISILTYSDAVLEIEIRSADFVKFISYTILIGIIPSVIRALSMHNWLLKKHLKEATNLNLYLNRHEQYEQEKLLVIQSDILKERIETTNQELAYVEASQNYVDIHTVHGHQIQSRIIRVALRKAKQQINDPYIVQCHRSFLVNLRMVTKIKSNSQGIYLELRSQKVDIPVSRTFKKEVVSLLKSLPHPKT